MRIRLECEQDGINEEEKEDEVKQLEGKDNTSFSRINSKRGFLFVATVAHAAAVTCLGFSFCSALFYEFLTDFTRI